MATKLRVLCPNSLSHKGGGYLRAFHITKLASINFDDTSIYALDEKDVYHEKVNQINLIQTKKYANLIDRYKYYTKGLFSKKFYFNTSGIAFENVEDCLFQIEGPYYYYLLNKKGINEYILDEQNVYWEMLNFPSYNMKGKIYNKLCYQRDKNIEIDALKNASEILVCSEIDRQKILNVIPEIDYKISVIPNCVDYNEYKVYQTDNADNDSNYSYKKFKVVFVGSLLYAPNTDAVNIICNEIAPNFSNNVEFIIIGNNPPKVKHPQNVKFLGYVPDVKKIILESDICISPLRYGSGTRLKILEYMAMGKTVISTSKAAEGIEYHHGVNIIIEDDIRLYVKRINELLDDRKKRKQIGKNAVKLICEKYNWEIYQRKITEIYSKYS